PRCPFPHSTWTSSPGPTRSTFECFAYRTTRRATTTSCVSSGSRTDQDSPAGVPEWRQSSILPPVSGQTLELWVSDDPRRPRTDGGDVVDVPDGWDLLPPGDAALTRRVKAAGPAWVVKKKRGRRTFSQGLWAPADTIAKIRLELEVERADPRYAAKLDAGRKRRSVEQTRYVEEFTMAVRAFLAFAPAHAALEAVLAEAIVRHSTPV